MGQVAGETVRGFLSSMDFPASKDDLVRYAEGRAAADDDEVVEALRALPLGDYENREQVVRSIDTVEATGQTPSSKGRQAKEGAPPGLAEHERRTRD